MNRDKHEGKKGKLHILQVHNYYQIPGGEDQVVKSDGKLLREHGHKVWLYARKNEELSEMKLWRKICLPFTTVFSFKTYREVKRLIKEKKIDVVHVHNTLPLISPSVFYAAFVSGVPVIMTGHNFRLLCPRGDFYRKGKVCEACVKKGLYESVKHGCYRGSRLQTLLCAFTIKLHRMAGTYQKVNYICLTEFNRDKLLNSGKLRFKRVFIKSNCMEYWGKAVSREERENYFLYAGRLEEEKGIKVLLEAFRKLPDFNLVICGKGTMEPWSFAYVQKHHMKNVIFKGQLSREETVELMSKAEGVIVPSLWYEGFCLIIAEAFSVKTPVVGSNIGNVGRLVENGVNGWKFEAGNTEELIKAIKQCSLQEEMSFRPDKKSEIGKDWSEEENYKKLIQIYRRCIADVRKAKEK